MLSAAKKAELRAEAKNQGGGAMMISGSDMEELLDELEGKGASPGPSANQAALANLTQRERAVVDLLAAGASTRDIAQKLTLTIATVNTYMKRIFAKLSVHSRVELIAVVNGRL